MQASQNRGVDVAGAIVAGLLVLPAIFVGGFGFALLITEGRLAWGIADITWSACALAGAYELVRQSAGWKFGKEARYTNLWCGVLAACIAITVSGAIRHLLPLVGVFPIGVAIPALWTASGKFGKFGVVGLPVVSLLAAGWLAANPTLSNWLMGFLDEF